jgi:hypothetical protein
MMIMKTYNLKSDVKIFGSKIEGFPNGIQEAFDELIKKTGDDAGERNYYGISEMIDGKIICMAAAEEKISGEAEKYNYNSSIIEKGEYLVSVLNDWKNKTTCIKDICYELVQDNRTDKTKPCIEWYKNGNEMWCMIKIKI